MPPIPPPSPSFNADTNERKESLVFSSPLDPEPRSFLPSFLTLSLTLPLCEGGVPFFHPLLPPLRNNVRLAALPLPSPFVPLHARSRGRDRGRVSCCCWGRGAEEEEESPAEARKKQTASPAASGRHSTSTPNPHPLLEAAARESSCASEAGQRRPPPPMPMPPQCAPSNAFLRPPLGRHRALPSFPLFLRTANGLPSHPYVAVAVGRRARTNPPHPARRQDRAISPHPSSYYYVTTTLTPIIPLMCSCCGSRRRCFGPWLRWREGVAKGSEESSRLFCETGFCV